ncbi:DMT family transporter [Poseidonocella sedimentorum]|uniref:EamA-like transporter family protein n=1 Tax=Poseidonocella sedimentorum TaxID=871652 RepID=A0A1I6DUA5_9RHOB|nr:DMT family transporter [Poseidonocella sedimentorum]SFR09059.1 EamA-like transporter family protein [Poseidonocella sedimentorum]
MTTPRLSPLSLALLLLLALMWGSSFLFFEIALRALPPLTVTLHRVGWAVPVLWLILRASGQRIPRGWGVWGAYLVLGLLNNVIPFTLIGWGQTSIESGLAAILNGTTAFFGAIVAGLLLADERLTAGKLAGAAIGLGGVAVIMGPSALTSFDPRDLGQLAILGAALSYAFAGVWSRSRLSGQDPIANAFGMVSASAGLSLALQLAVLGPPKLSLALETWAVIFALAVLSTALAYVLYFRILALAGATNLLMVTLLVPPVAILLGWLVLDETLPASVGAGFGLIALGLVVSDGRLLPRRGKKPASG